MVFSSFSFNKGAMWKLQAALID